MLAIAGLAVLVGGAVVGWMVHEVNPYLDLDRSFHTPAAYDLPNRLIVQQASPDGVHVAQILYHERAGSHYLAIVSRPQRTRLLLDRELPLDPGADASAVKLTWRGNYNVVLEMARGSDDQRLRYEFDIRTFGYGRAAQPAESLSLAEAKRPTEPGAEAEPPTSQEQFAPQLRPVILDAPDDRLLLYRQIPIGVSYQELKAALPGLSSLRREAGDDLFEATVAFDVFGYPGRVEFNFKNERLYNYMYSATANDAVATEALYRQLQAYYSGHFGAYEEERVRESPHYAVVSSHWQAEHIALSLVHNITPGSHLITWSFGRRD